MSSPTGRVGMAALAIAVVALAVAVAGLLVRPAAPAAGPATQTFAITAREFAFDVNGQTNPTLRVKVGDLVKMVFKNGGGLTHELLIVADKDEAEAAEKAGQEPGLPFSFEIEHVGPGQQETLTFVASHSGTFFYVCFEAEGTEPDLHADKGMVGQFIVEP